MFLAEIQEFAGSWPGMQVPTAATTSLHAIYAEVWWEGDRIFFG